MLVLRLPRVPISSVSIYIGYGWFQLKRTTNNWCAGPAPSRPWPRRAGACALSGLEPQSSSVRGAASHACGPAHMQRSAPWSRTCVQLSRPRVRSSARPCAPLARVTPPRRRQVCVLPRGRRLGGPLPHARPHHLRDRRDPGGQHRLCARPPAPAHPPLSPPPRTPLVRARPLASCCQPK
jgi:hypothetical protein